MLENKNHIGGGGNNLLVKKEILTNEQVKILKDVGTCMIATSSRSGEPHCTIVEPSRIENNQIIIPIVQMVVSKQNILENSKIYLHFYKINPEDAELNTQYKISANATIETSGKLFEEIKHYEETEVLPEGFYVNGIVIAELLNMEKFVG